MSRSDTETKFVETLLRWYEDNGRHGLPWRGASPFDVLVAEFMLQRTSAEQVIGVFESFVERYPDPYSIADASVEELVDALAPLGLRKRAGYLKRTSEVLVERHDGEVPNEREELLELTGVGEYTAVSVLAHAHDEDVAAADTNVVRILTRAFALSAGDSPRTDEARELAEKISPSERSGDFLHALIDLGAAVCTASNPSCGECPVEATCEYAADPEG